MKRRSLFNAIRTAIVASVAISCGVAVAAPAQTQGAAQQATAGQHKKKPITLQAVTVTGSHIPTTALITAHPVTVVTREQIQATGLQTIGQVLQNLPAVAPTMNASFNFEGNGASNIDLRYLGATRTLVLVNGQRWVPNIDGTTDLNSIPLAAVDRIEVLKSGASAIYGSDAIAGVVNIILRNNMNGGNASAYYGVWNGDGHWDGQTHQYSFTFGHQGKKYGFLFSAEYNKSDRIPAINRNFSAEPVPMTGVTRGSSSTPQGRFQFIAPTLDNPNNSNVSPAPYTGLTAAQCPATNFGTSSSPEFLPFCDITPTIGTDGSVAADFQPWKGSDAYNWTEPSGGSKGDSILDPLTVRSAYMSGHYDVTSNLRVLASINYTQSNSVTTSAPNLLPLTTGTIAANQQYNPFGFPISAAPVQVAPTGGSNGGPLMLPTLSFIGRRLSEFPPRVRNYESDSFRFNGGVSGSFTLGPSDWNWDAGLLYMTLRDTEVQTAGILGPNFAAATGSPAACSAAPGCVPLDLFGGQGVNGHGTMSPAQVAYIYYPEDSNDGTTQRIYHAGASTDDLVELPAGGLGVAVGYQYDEINGYFNPDPIAAAGLAQGVGKTFPTNGGFSSNAFYTEVHVPLLAHEPLFYRVSVDVAARYTNYNTVGGSTKSQIGLKWEPVEDLALRADWGQGFRAPNINELFAGQGLSNPTVFDPCSGYTRPGVNPAIVRNCAAAGVPGGYVQPDQQILTLEGGNQRVQPETSTSEDAGFVYNPHQIPALSLSATYYRIKIKNTIQPYGPNNILNACYISNDPQFCSEISRTQTGTVSEIVDLETNIGSTTTGGIDVSAMYKDLPTPIGDFSVAFNASHVINYTELLPLAGTTNRIDLVGVERAGFTFPLSVPSWRGVLTFGWHLGRWNATWRVHYISALLESCSDSFDGTSLSLTALGLCNRPNLTNNSLSMNRMAPTVWHDAQVVYNGRFGLTYTFGVNNIFNKAPPNEVQPIEDLAFDPSEYEALMGRFFYGRVAVKF
ncbi:MAG TPA: TonB-dependent receptor [Rhodanobacteraceae bacterium]